MTIDLRQPPTAEAPLSAGALRYHDLGQGTPVVLLHGLLLNSAFWRKVAPALVGRARVIAPDLPLGGHRVPMRAGADLAPPAIADLVAELLDHLGLERAVVVGNDTGGAVAQLFAVRHPERVAALVLTPCDAFENFLPVLLRYTQLAARIPGGIWLAAQALRSPVVQRLPIAIGWLAKHPLPADVTELYLAPSRRDRGVRRDVAKVLRGISRTQTRQAAEGLRRLAAPQVLVWADTRKIFPVAHARRLAAQAPDGRLVLVPDSYAFVPEDNPGPLVDALVRLLEELDGREPAGACGTTVA
jgi:pimeloyl-ACP methyl ester carboxylesterase